MIDYQIRVMIKEDIPGHGQFNDCIYYAPAAFAKMSKKQVEADKRARVDNWVNHIEAQREAQADPKVIAEQEAVAVKDRKRAMKEAVLADTPEMIMLLDKAIDAVSKGVTSREQIKAEILSTLEEK